MRIVRLWIPLAVVLLLTGCSTPERPDHLRIEPAMYEVAFDAAVDAARNEGLTPSFRDRRVGIIETEPATAPTIIEPWIIDGSGLDRRLQYTVGHYRRRVRFEFEPATGETPPSPMEPVVLLGPDLLDVAGDAQDLPAAAIPTVLRVRVYVEQAHIPGTRRNTWTRRAATRAEVRATIAGDPVPGTYWTPVERDHRFERFLVDKVAQAIGLEDEPADTSGGT